MSIWRERYKVHPAANVFPMLSDDELAKLGQDIAANGLQSPIICQDASELLLDGRNRLEAMERAGLYNGHVDTVFVKGDPVSAIISANVHRRHLTKEQRARMLAAEYFANVGEVSVDPHKGGRGKVNEAKAAVVAKADKLKISKRTVERVFEKATDHPNAPQPLRAKARRKKKRETLQHYHALLATLPRNPEGARRFYLEIVSRHVVDIPTEMTAVVDGLQRIADQPEAERLKRRAAR